MISNPAFLFGFYSRRVITGRKPYKRLPGNEGKDVTFHVKTTLIPPQTSTTPSTQPIPPLPSVWDPPTHSPPLLLSRRERDRAVGGRCWQPQRLSPDGPVPPGQGKQAAPGRTEEAEESAPRLKLGCWCSRTLLHGVQTCSERFLGSDM